MPRPQIVAVAGTDDRLWTVDDAAQYLGLTRKGVYGLISTRRIPFVRMPSSGKRGGPIRFVRSELLEWLGQNRVSALES